MEILSAVSKLSDLENKIESLPFGETIIASVKTGAVFLWFGLVNMTFNAVEAHQTLPETISQWAEVVIKGATGVYLLFRMGNEIYKWRIRKKKQ